jgi:phage FluMu protein Com
VFPHSVFYVFYVFYIFREVVNILEQKVRNKVGYLADTFGKKGKNYYLSVFEKLLDFEFPKSEIEKVLDKMVEENKLLKKYDLRCKHCSKTIGRANTLDLKDLNLCCPNCNRELEDDEFYKVPYFKIL